MMVPDGVVSHFESPSAEPKPSNKYPLDADGLPRPQSPTLDKIIARQEAAKEAAHQDKADQPQSVSPVESNEPGYRADPIVVPINPDVAAYQFPEVDPPSPPKQTRTRTPKNPHTIPRPNWRRDLGLKKARSRFQLKRRPNKNKLAEPWSYESARLYAWTFYRMQKLNLQLMEEICEKQEKIEQLKRQLNTPAHEQAGEPTHTPRPVRRTGAKTFPMQTQTEQNIRAAEDHAAVEAVAAQDMQETNERGPP